MTMTITITMTTTMPLHCLFLRTTPLTITTTFPGRHFSPFTNHPKCYALETIKTNPTFRFLPPPSPLRNLSSLPAIPLLLPPPTTPTPASIPYPSPLYVALCLCFLGWLLGWGIVMVVLFQYCFFFSFCLLLKSLQKKRNGLGQEPVTKVGVGGQRQTKKTKAENPTSTGHAKVRKINHGLLACRFLFCLHFELKLFQRTDPRPVVF